jgi:glycosyltransferase involved in cell wall biosynthesis
LQEIVSEIVRKNKYKIVLYSNADIKFDTNTIKQVCIPSYSKTYLHKLYWEFYGLKIHNKKKVFALISFDMMPNIDARRKFLYYHNVLNISKIDVSNYYFEPKLFLQKYLFPFFSTLFFNKEKDFVIVQQCWIKNILKNKFDKIIVKRPCSYIDKAIKNNTDDASIKYKNDKFYFYPSLPRPFKNHKLLIDAFILSGIKNNKLILTLDPRGNRYEKYIFNYARNVKNIIFIENIDHNVVINFMKYEGCVLLFPSKLESWGLPLSEAVNCKCKIIAIDKEYAHETVGNYNKVTFVGESAVMWGQAMLKIW